MNYFDVIRPLGIGGMGTVYHVLEHLPGGQTRARAIKRIRRELSGDADIVRRFEHEGMLHLDISGHPVIARAFDFAEDTAGRYLKLEFIDGASLEEFIQHAAPVPHEVVRRILRALAEALAHIHSHGVIHRDISPGNVLVSLAGAVKVIDFGLARRLDTAKTEPGFKGTSAYASPEALAGGTLGPSADLWSLGALAYALLTGGPPFGDGDRGAINERIEKQGMEPLPDTVPEDLREAVGLLLQLDPDGRLQGSATSVLKLLDRHAHPLADDSVLGELAQKTRKHVPDMAGEQAFLTEHLRKQSVRTMHGEQRAGRRTVRRGLAVFSMAALLVAASFLGWVTRGRGMNATPGFPQAPEQTEEHDNATQPEPTPSNLPDKAGEAIQPSNDLFPPDHSATTTNVKSDALPKHKRHRRTGGLQHLMGMQSSIPQSTRR